MEKFGIDFKDNLFGKYTLTELMTDKLRDYDAY